MQKLLNILFDIIRQNLHLGIEELGKAYCEKQYVHFLAESYVKAVFSCS